MTKSGQSAQGPLRKPLTAEQRTKKAKTDAAWHAANREQANARRAAWAAANPTKEAARRAKWRTGNVEKIRLQTKAWLIAHPEWKRDPEKKRARDSNRRARKRGAAGKFTLADIERIRLMQGDKCAICKARLKGKGHRDHIEPIVSGGTNWPSNIQLLCRLCNIRKGAKDPLKFSRELGLLI